MLQGVQGMFANMSAQVSKNVDETPRDRTYGKQYTTAPVVAPADGEVAG